ncbi:hypothetical protein [Dolichospermum compactum]|nr:hypothetical protein [Dolichospermum compactum]
MSNIRLEMPVLSRHEGEWLGNYTVVDDSSIILWFGYKEFPYLYLYEMIQISHDNNHRARTWHWFKNHQIYQRTLIQEERVK